MTSNERRNSLPKKHGFPSSKIDGKKSFVVVVDAQIDFMRESGALYVPDAELTGHKINRFLASLNPADCCGVLFTFDTHYIDEYASSEEAQQFPPHCLYSTPGWTLDVDYKSISSEIPQYMLSKNYFDMWKDDPNTEKDISSFPMPRSLTGSIKQSNFFNNLKKDIHSVIVIGVASDFCVKFAISGFLERGFHVITDSNLCAHIETPLSEVCDELRKFYRVGNNNSNCNNNDSPDSNSSENNANNNRDNISSAISSDNNCGNGSILELYDLTSMPRTGWFQMSTSTTGRL